MKIIPEFLATQFENELKFPDKTHQETVMQTCSIMVIDDDPGLQSLIEQTLAPGASVVQEMDVSAENIESLVFDGIDAVIIDYRTPGEDGLDVLKKIRTKYSQLPVLFMTEFGDLSIAKEAIAAGANEYFPKPFDPSDLKEVVSKWVPTFEPATQRNIAPTISREVSPLQNVAEIENFLTAKYPDGIEFRARVVRYNSRSIVVEAALDQTFEIGITLEDTSITLGHRSMAFVSALVYQVTHLAEKQLVEITLPGVWQIEGFEEGTDPEEVSRIIRSRDKSPLPTYSRFDRGLWERKLIPESYRSVVLEIEQILQDFYDDLEPFEKFLYQVGNDERTEIERRMIEYAEGRFFPNLTLAMNKFEQIAELASQEGIQDELGRFAQKRLFPLLLCSPFVNRVVTKPIGIPGDFGILGQLLGHPYDGHTLYSRMLNAWILSTSGSIAYRHRIDLLEHAIEEAVEKAAKEGRRAKILSMASGVAYEVQRFVQKAEGNPEVDFELVDFSDRTLFEAKKLFTSGKKFNDPSEVGVTLRHGSVIDLAKQSRKERTKNAEQYDLVYCAGLFDYLSSRMCSNIVTYLHDMTMKGGKVVVSNYTPENPNCYLMGVLLEWKLIYRSRDEFDALMKTTSAKDSYHLVEDSTKSEVYAIVKKV